MPGPPPPPQGPGAPPPAGPPAQGPLAAGPGAAEPAPPHPPVRRRRAARKRRPPKLAFVALGVSLLGAVAFVAWIVLPEASGPRPAAGAAPARKPPAPARGDAPPDDSAVSGPLEDPATQGLLATQPEAKRNQILFVDLYRQLLGRYPDASEQRRWLPGDSEGARALEALRKRGGSDADVANYICGALMDADSYKARFPSLLARRGPDAEARPSTDYSASAVAAMVARVIHYRDDIPRENDLGLMLRIQNDFELTSETANRPPAMERVLRGISGTTDVGEHFIEDRNDDAVEVEGMRTLLRGGKLLVLSGNDVEPRARYVLVFGFDKEGSFLVRDPLGKMPEKVPPRFLVAFMRKPSLMGDASGAGFWLDLPSSPTRVRCVSHPVGPPRLVERAIPLSFDTPGGVTGVIPGAQVNLAPMRIPPGEHSIRGTLSITAEQIDAILHEAHSPAAGTGRVFVRWGQYYNIDPIWALAVFRRESELGTHPRWVGRKPGGGNTRNPGNIRYVGRPNPARDPQYGEFNGFRDYATWADGIHDWFKLLAQDSNYAGLHTVERILPRYAPRTENDTDNYIRDVIRWVGEWRALTRESGAVEMASAEVGQGGEAAPEVECKEP